jgi:hypothetical protein
MQAAGYMVRLTKRQRDAVALLKRSRHPGVLTSSKSVMVDGQPWIHWMTAYALHEKGVVRVTNYGQEDAEVHLCPAGTETP